MPRFVILYHELPADAGRPSHWDLMLEQGEALRTWALAGPLERGMDVPAERLDDHRLAYLDYEGPISNNRGHVQRWDAGTFEAQPAANGSVRIKLCGERCQGTLTLTMPITALPQRWIARFSAD